MIKQIKKILIIIGTMIFIICVLIAIFKLNSKDGEENTNIFNKLDESQDISDLNDEKFVELGSYNIYYSVKNILNQYIIYLKSINGDEELDVDRIEGSKDEIYVSAKEDGIKAVYNIFDDKYIKECNISQDNIINFAEKIKINGNYNENEVYNLDIKQMYMAGISTNITIVLVEFELNDEQYSMIIKLDINNYTYSIFGKEYIEKFSYNKDTQMNEINIDQNEIEKNEYNNFSEVYISNEYIVDQIFLDYKQKILYYSKKAYQLLDKEYREKRYGNYETFNNYIQMNYDRIEQTSLKKYQINNYDEYTEYICLDQNNNYYIFREKSFFDYSVLLDTYTIEQQETIDRYNNANEQTKVGMNIEKIKEALNNKDYEYVYSKLDNNFKENSFGNYEQFISYMQENFFDVNKFEYTNFTKEGEIYVYDVKVSQADVEEENFKNATIIMKLLDNRDFVMSFSIE